MSASEVATDSLMRAGSTFRSGRMAENSREAPERVLLRVPVMARSWEDLTSRT